jgi:protein-tyrosine phosphatase
LDLRAGYPYSKDRIGHKIPLEDNVADEKTVARFLEGAAKLNEWVSQGRRVIVHCMAGMSRSVSVVITYLMYYMGWSYQTAYTLVKLRRWQTNIFPDYVAVLEQMNTS